MDVMSYIINGCHRNGSILGTAEKKIIIFWKRTFFSQFYFFILVFLARRLSC